jgi:hypothetical protein
VSRTEVPLAVRIVAALLVAVLVLVGLWIAGGLITNDFDLAMWLSVGWMVLAAVLCAVVAFLIPALRGPVLGAYVVVALVVGIYLARSIFLEDEVQENVVTATAPGQSAQRNPGGAAGAIPTRGNVLLRTGAFQSVRHEASGRANMIDLAQGGRVLTLTGFEVDNGPDLRVYLVRGPARTESEVEDHVDLGTLKGSKGNQQYEMPDRVDLNRYSTVVVWCRAFSVLFARAPTRG